MPWSAYAVWWSRNKFWPDVLCLFGTIWDDPAKLVLRLSTLVTFVFLLILAINFELRYRRPQPPLLVIAPFEVGAADPPSLGVTGRTVTNILLDEMEALSRKAAAFQSETLTSERARSSSALRLSIPSPDTNAPAEGEIGGWSLAKWTQSIDAIRRNRRMITGDLVSGTDSLFLRARVEGEEPWVVGPVTKDVAGLEKGCRELAEKMLTTLRPEMAISYLYAKGEQARALDIARGWVVREPNNASAHSSLGIVLQLQGQRSETMKAYNKVLSLRPYDADTLNNLGLELSEEGQVDGAIVAFRKSLRIRPDNRNANLNLAYALNLKGRSLYKKGLFERGDIDLELIDEAITAYEESASLVPDDPESLHGLGLAYRQAGRENEAKKVFERVQQLNPNMLNPNMKPPE